MGSFLGITGRHSVAGVYDPGRGNERANSIFNAINACTSRLQRAHSHGGSYAGYIGHGDRNDQVELPAPTRSWQRSVPAQSSQASALP